MEIVVVVEGGLVRDIYTDVEGLTVHLVDHDVEFMDVPVDAVAWLDGEAVDQQTLDGFFAERDSFKEVY